MPKVKNVEKKIWEIEGFDVTIKYPNGGSDVRGDKNGITQYAYKNAAKHDMTVNEWKNNRFSKCYPGFDVDVLNGDGDTVPGQTHLGTVRDSYAETDE